MAAVLIEKVSLAALDDLLHDATVPLSSVGISEDGSLWLSGSLYDTYVLPGSKRSRPVKRPFRLRIASTEHLLVDDPHELGVVEVCNVTFDEDRGTLTIESCMAGQLLVQTRERHAEFHLFHPTDVRRLFRWRQIDAG